MATTSSRAPNETRPAPQKKADVTPGCPSPLGASVTEAGVNFSVFSRHASGMELLLFDREDDASPARTIPIDPVAGRTYHYWHVLVPQLKPGQLYGYRATGPSDPANGLRFDSKKALLDPYGRGVTVPKSYTRAAATAPGDNAAAAMKSVVVDPSTYDWQGDRPLRTPAARTIIYEMHLRGFTRHPSSGVTQSRRGTYAGLIEKIPYLKELGITAVELLPVFQYDATDCPRGVVNYWGYQPVSFFAPHQAYSSRRDPLGPVDEFRDMVKALHRAGIEVILDVVFNHTTEAGAAGPTLCFRGLDNPAYYILDAYDRARYADYSGCGNTLNANHPIVRRLIIDSVRYWVEQMHVDGFRFDLASILSRDPSGNVMPSPPVLWDLESDPALAGTKFIAEAWDAAGLYQVGTFVGDSWKEWNGRFRDGTRSFFRGDNGSVRRIADGVLGSPEMYQHENREPEQSVNFATCHDGFTLNDLVSYNEKHNLGNGDQNRDGNNDNISWNCGCEGATTDPKIEKLRNRQVKNFLAATLLSVGMPMILMGDEMRRTQKGNNNDYCHDDETNWLDWTLLNKHADVHRFVTLINARRTQRTVEYEHGRLTLAEVLQRATRSWHGVRLHQPDWGDFSHSIALSAELAAERLVVHLILNAYSEALRFELPRKSDAIELHWRRWIDTGLETPQDIVPWESAPPVSGSAYRAEARSVVLLLADVGA